jgi:hypothetical protein
MDINNPHDWAQLAAAFKDGEAGIRGVVTLVQRLRNSGVPSPEIESNLNAALEEAERSLQLAEANISQALGYPLCRCAFPPTAMLTVGYMSRGPRTGEAVDECPKCRRNTASPSNFVRNDPVQE